MRKKILQKLPMYKNSIIMMIMLNNNNTQITSTVDARITFSVRALSS